MKDVRLVIRNLRESINSDIIKINELPRIGEYISSVYFKDKYPKLKYQSSFLVTNIIHHYVDDMSEIDFTEIELDGGI